MGTLGWLGPLDRTARPLAAVVLSLIIGCAVMVCVVRGEVSQTSPLKRALIEHV